MGYTRTIAALKKDCGVVGEPMVPDQMSFSGELVADLSAIVFNSLLEENNNNREKN